MLKTMMKITLSTFVCALSAFGGLSKENNVKATTTILLNGVSTTVFFNDGDTFKIIDSGERVRINHINTLETYGPVHQWLDNTPDYLLDIAHLATTTVRNGSWNCVTDEGKDVYGRLLATCDDLARKLLSTGLAHAYSIDSQAAPKKYLNSQKKAQDDGLGMWKNGIPAFIITSLHSADEGEKDPANRLISTADGSSEKMHHHESYGTCEKVCLDQDNSCMVYVPYEQRYGANRPTCIR